MARMLRQIDDEVLDESLDESPLLDAVSVLSVVPQAATAISMAALRAAAAADCIPLLRDIGFPLSG